MQFGFYGSSLPLNYSDIGELRCNSLALQPSEDDVTVTSFSTNRLVLSVNLRCSGCFGVQVDAWWRQQPSTPPCISHHITHHSSQHYANDFINRWIFKTFSEWNKKADTFIQRVNDNFSVFITFRRFCSSQLPTKPHTLVGFSQSGSTIRSLLGPQRPRICINCHCWRNWQRWVAFLMDAQRDYDVMARI